MAALSCPVIGISAMTPAAKVLIIGEGSSTPRAKFLAGELSRRLRPNSATAVEAVALETVDADAITDASAVIMIPCERFPARTWRSLARLCDEHDVATLAIASARGEDFGAALHLQPNAPPDLLATTLDAVLHPQRTVRRLRGELSLAHRFHGGLRGEISRIHDELQLAALVQQEFLPRELPSLHGVTFGALWRPANYVAGDIYDIHRLDEDHIGIFLADAVGHGVPAALLTMVIARGLPTKEITGSSYRIVPPGEALARLNEEMIRRQGDTARFATAVYGVMNCRSRTLRLAGAGHPAPLLLRDAGAPLPLETSGGLLGVFPDEQNDEIEVELRADDCILLYSDGFEMAFPRNGQVEESDRLPSKRYLDEFAALARLDAPQDMVHAMIAQLDAQPGSLHQSDDLTLIVLHAGSPTSAIAHHAAPRNHASDMSAPLQRSAA